MQSILKFYLKIACLFLNCLSFSVHAGLVILENTTHKVSLGQKMQYLEDPTGKLTLTDLLSNRTSINWQQSEHDAPNFGLTQSTYWFKLKVISTATDKNWFLEITYPLLDNVTIYVVRNNRVISEYTTGDTIPGRERIFYHRNFIYPLEFQPNFSYEVYLTSHTSGAMQMPAYLADQQTFFKGEQLSLLAYGAFYGTMLCMILYNLFIFFATGDKSYIYYVFFVAFHTLFQGIMYGIAQQFFNHNSLWITGDTLILSISFTLGFALIFSQSFLEIKQYYPRVANAFSILSGLLFALGLLSYLLPYAYTAKVALLFVPVVAFMLLSVGFKFSLQGNHVARIFTAAWCFLLLGSLVMMLDKTGLIPTTFVTRYGAQLGAVTEVILLSIALAAKINLLRDKTIRAQEEAIEKANEAEVANEKLISLQKEKMEAVTQMTVGVAHEINTPLGIVTTAATLQEQNLQEIYQTKDGNEAQDKMFAMKEGLMLSNNMIVNNLRRIDSLLKTFKNIVVNKEDDVTIKLYETLQVTSGYFKLDKFNGNITLHIDCPKDLEITTCPTILSQSLVAIVSNCYTHAFNAQEKGNIYIKVETLDTDTFEIKVSDDGAGIEPRLISKVFDPFTTNKRGSGNVGLGLSMVHNAIHNVLQGKIECSSIVNEGTTFTITLPLDISQKKA